MTHKKDETKDPLECKDVVKKIFEYIDGELDEHTHDDIEHHLEHCRSCFSRAEFEAELKSRVKNAGEEKAPEKLNKRLNNLIDNF